MNTWCTTRKRDIGCRAVHSKSKTFVRVSELKDCLVLGMKGSGPQVQTLHHSRFVQAQGPSYCRFRSLFSKTVLTCSLHCHCQSQCGCACRYCYGDHDDLTTGSRMTSLPALIHCWLMSNLLLPVAFLCSFGDRLRGRTIARL